MRLNSSKKPSFFQSSQVKNPVVTRSDGSMDFDDAQYSIVEVLALASWSPNLEVPGATKVPTYLFHPSFLQVPSPDQSAWVVPSTF